MSLIQTRVLTNIVFKHFIISPVCTRLSKVIQNQYSTPSITNDHATKIEETFVSRLLAYLKDDKHIPIKNSNMEVEDVLKKSENDIRKFETDEIVSTLSLFSPNNLLKGRYEFSETLKILDTELCKRLSHLETQDKLNILHTYMRIIPHKIIRYNYYKHVIEDLCHRLEMLNRQELIQLIFFIGLQKKCENAQHLLRKCMEPVIRKFLDNLTTEDLCILCNSTFKTSTKIKSKILLNKIVNHINENLNVCNDPAILVTLIKSIRHNRYASEELLATLSYTFFFNKSLTKYSFPALCHILALYADFGYYDDNLTVAITNKCIEKLKIDQYNTKNTYSLEQPRVKDIKRLLWCLHCLNYKYLKTDDIKNIVMPSILKRLDAGEFMDDTTSLNDIMLYLWSLNYRGQELVPYIFTKENVQLAKASKSPAKYRLNLLLSCIYFEDKTLYRRIEKRPPDNPNYDTRLELKQRPVLKRVLECLQKTITPHSHINKFAIGFQIPHLKIIGITGYRKNIYKTVHIEILDEYTCLKNTNSVPTGLMQLKLRILKELEEGLIVIHADEVNGLNDEELCVLLQDEIHFIC